MMAMEHAPTAPMQHVVLPPARRARRIALALSVVAVAFSIAFGMGARHAFSLRAAAPDVLVPWLVASLSLLLVAMLLRMGAALCELLWLERTWSNLPEHLRKVGPVGDVSSAMLIGISFVPGIAWLWKLGLIVAIADGLEAVRARAPFVGRIPKRLGTAAVVVGWIPGLNIYIAPFLWEMFATRIDDCVNQILASRPAEIDGERPTNRCA